MAVEAEEGEKYQCRDCTAYQQNPQGCESPAGRKIQHEDNGEDKSGNGGGQVGSRGHANGNAEQNNSRPPSSWRRIEGVGYPNRSEDKPEESPGRQNCWSHSGAGQQHGRTEAIERKRDVSTFIAVETA